MAKKHIFKIFGLGKKIAQTAAKPRLIGGKILNHGIHVMMIFLSYLFIFIILITMTKDLIVKILPKSKQEIKILALMSDQNYGKFNKLFKEFKHPDYKLSYNTAKDQSDLLRQAGKNDILIMSSQDFSVIAKNNILLPLDDSVKNKLHQEAEKNNIAEISNTFASLCETNNTHHGSSPQDAMVEQNNTSKIQTQQEKIEECNEALNPTKCNKSKNYIIIGQLGYHKNIEMLIGLRHLKAVCEMANFYPHK